MSTPCSVRMPRPETEVLFWEATYNRWTIGTWSPRYQQWSNRDDPNYAIHPHQVTHWQPLPESPK